MVNFYQVGSAWLVKDLILPAGSCYCGLTSDSTKVSIRLLSNGHQIVYELFSQMQDAAGTPYTYDTFMEASNAFFAGTVEPLPSVLDATLTRPADTSNYAAGDMIGTYTAKVKQVGTVTLTGVGGLANITGTGGLTKLVTFNSTLTQTATDFVTSHAVAYHALDPKVVVTASGDDIIFTAHEYDTTFVPPVITNVSDNLTGSVTHTLGNTPAVAQKETITLSGTAAAIQQETMALTCTPHTKMKVTIPITGTLPVKQKEIITITGSSGTFTVTGTGGFTNIATWNTTEDATATDFRNNNAAEYATAGVVVTASNHTIIFEAAVAGVGFTAPICTDGDTDLHGEVSHDTANLAAGTANLTVVGLAAKLMTFNTNVATTISDFVTLWAASYYDGVGIHLTGSATDIILESDTLGVAFGVPDVVTLTGNLSHGTIEDTVAYVATGAGTITGLGSPREITFATSVDDTATTWAAANLADYLAAGIDLTTSTNSIIFTARVAGTGFTSPVLSNSDGDLAGGKTVNQVNVAQGTGTITGVGTSKTVTFNTTATQTATDFKNAAGNIAYYAGLGATLSSSGADIIFTAAVAGTGFTAPIYTKTGGDLEGVLASTATKHYDNVVAVKQIETILVSGSSGQFTVNDAGGLTKVLTFVTNIQASLAAFVSTNAGLYDDQGIVLTNTTTQLVFTAKTAGTSFTAPTISGNTDDLAGTVVTIPNVSYLPVTIEDAGISLNGGGVLNTVWVETDAVQFAGKTICCWMFKDVPVGLVADNAAFVDDNSNAAIRTANSYFTITFNALVAGSTRIFGRAVPNAKYNCISTSKDLYMVVTATEGITTPATSGVFQFFFDVTKIK
jgi:hypothetical protein